MVPGESSAYSPIILSTPHVLDAAVQTINALHHLTPFDFGISLGDDCNNSQYNELRWFLDTIDGKVITPSSGAHVGATTIDYQMPFYAAGLNPEIPWYQVIGNHDQFWMGSAFENTKTRSAHIGSTILNIEDNPGKPIIDSTGAYMGVRRWHDAIRKHYWGRADGRLHSASHRHCGCTPPYHGQSHLNHPELDGGVL